MNRLLSALTLLFVCSTTLAADTFAPHIVIVRENQRAFIAEWPVPDAQLEDAKTIYAWTEELPIQRFTRSEFLRERAELKQALAKSVAGQQRVLLRTATPKRRLSDVIVRYAPPDVWTHIPESLLPEAHVTPEGIALLPYRDAKLRVRAFRDGESTTWIDVRPSKTLLELDLLPASDAIVRLTGDGPIDGATATMLLHERGVANPVMTAQYAATAKGELRVSSMPQTDVITLMIFAPDFAAASMTGVAEDLSRTIMLTRAGALRGRFVDHKGKPVAGAVVTVEAWVAEDLPALSRVEATSDADGKWTMRDLPLREATLLVRAKGFATHRDRVTPAVPETNLGDIELSVATPFTIEVVDDDEKPVKSASVRLGGIRAGMTNDKGQLVIADASNDQPAQLSIEHDEFETARTTFDPPFAKLERIVLERRFILRGHLIDEQQLPVTDARALIEFGNTYRTQTVKDDGTFAITAPRDQEVRLTFESPSTSSHTLTEPPGKAGEVRDLGAIRLDRGNVVRGRIVDRDGQPVIDARVWVLRPTASGTIGSWIAERAIETRSRRDGTFQLSGVVTGAITMRIDARGFARAQRDLVTDNANTDIGEVVVSRGSDVIVTMPSSATDAVARVDLTGSWLEVDMLVAPLLDGKATLRNVPPGEHTVTVTRALSVVCEKNAVVPDDGRRIEVACGAPIRVTGQVLMGNAPAFGGSLSWTRVGRVMTESLINTTVSELGTRRQAVLGAGSGMTVIDVDARGRFSSDELLPGSWSVTWSSPDGSMAKPRRIEIPDAPNAEITLKYEGALVSGRVVDPHGAPVVLARVQTEDGHLAFCREDGTFRLVGLTPGRYTLQARKGELASRRLEIIVKDEDPITGLELSLDPEISEAVNVRVIAAAGEPAANAFVFVESDAGTRILTTDAKGEAKATFASGRPPSVRLAAFHQSVWSFAVANTNQQSSVLLRLDAGGALRIATRKSAGALQLLTSSMMDVVAMMGRLGIPASLSIDAPLVISGLPPGRYTLIAGGEMRVVDVRAHDTVGVELP